MRAHCLLHSALLLALHQVVDTGPYRSAGLGLGLQFVQAGQAALPDKGGGADGGLLAGHGFKVATGATAQRAQGVAAGQAVQQFGVL